MRGDQPLRVVSVRGFPPSTGRGFLDDLNRLGFAYRWSTRFLCLDKSEAEKELTRLRRQWFAKRKNVIALLRETIFQQESPLDRKSTRLNSSHLVISYAVFCLKKKK